MASHYVVGERDSIRVPKLNADHAAIAALAGSGAGTTTNAVTFATSGGAAPATTFNGSVARTIDYSTVGAAKVGLATASGLTMSTARMLGRITAATGAIEELTATQAKSFLAIATSDVSGLATVATSGSASDLGSGTLPAGRMPALTGDVTSSAGSVATTVGKINGVALSGLTTGILKNTTTTGVPSIAVAGDFPTLNQNTTGSAATLTTSRNFSISGGGITAAAVGFNGSAAVALSASVDASHITLARMADVATSTVFYRKTAGTGAPEVQTLATLKTDLGLTGTNSGDQTSIVGITGTIAQFNTAVTDADLVPTGLAITSGLTMGTGKLLGRSSALTGAIEELATLPAANMPALTGDVATSAGSLTTTLASVNPNVGSFGSATAIPVFTVVGKGLIVAASTAANTGGWVETTLTADSATTSASFATITDGTRSFSFTPTANANYEVQAVLLIQTATATVLPEIQVNVSAQGASSYGCVQMDQTGATVTSRVTQDGTWTTGAVTVAFPAGGVAVANTPYLCYVTIRGHAGASPAAIALQLASETAGTSVRVLAGSQMRTKVT